MRNVRSYNKSKVIANDQSSSLGTWNRGSSKKENGIGPSEYPMVWYAVMATMTHRTTFALDENTIRKLRILSVRWKVSLAEAVRRAVAQAEAQGSDQKPNPVEMLRQLHDSGQSLDPEKAEAYLAQVYEDRKHWRGE
jgi:hypothetical protein